MSELINTSVNSDDGAPSFGRNQPNYELNGVQSCSRDDGSEVCQDSKLQSACFSFGKQLGIVRENKEKLRSIDYVTQSKTQPLADFTELMTLAEKIFENTETVIELA